MSLDAPPQHRHGGDGVTWTHDLTDFEFARLRDDGVLICHCPKYRRDPDFIHQCLRCGRRIDMKFDPS